MFHWNVSIEYVTTGIAGKEVYSSHEELEHVLLSILLCVYPGVDGNATPSSGFLGMRSSGELSTHIWGRSILLALIGPRKRPTCARELLVPQLDVVQASYRMHVVSTLSRQDKLDHITSASRPVFTFKSLFQEFSVWRVSW